MLQGYRDAPGRVPRGKYPWTAPEARCRAPARPCRCSGYRSGSASCPSSRPRAVPGYESRWCPDTGTGNRRQGLFLFLALVGKGQLLHVHVIGTAGDELHLELVTGFFIFSFCSVSALANFFGVDSIFQPLSPISAFSKSSMTIAFSSLPLMSAGTLVMILDCAVPDRQQAHEHGNCMLNIIATVLLLYDLIKSLPS